MSHTKLLRRSIRVTRRLRVAAGCLIGTAVFMAVAGCPDRDGPAGKAPLLSTSGPGIQAVNWNDPVKWTPHDQKVSLAAAKNEWVSFAVQVTPPRATPKVVTSLKLGALQSTAVNEAIGVENYSAYQVLAMPIDLNRAGYVRHTGQRLCAPGGGGQTRLPRALLPLPIDHGQVNLDAARDPDHPENPVGRALSPSATGASIQPLLLWVDLHVPPQSRPGDYQTRVELLQSGSSEPLASLEVQLSVHDFVLPDERHLLMVGQIDWDSLARLYPGRFEGIRPSLLSRNDAGNAAAVRALDQLVTLAQANRTEVVIPRLQPTAKWHVQPPQVIWDEFDSVVMPWLTGTAFADKVGLGYWPLPVVDMLGNYDIQSRQAYWREAAAHFEQRDLLGRTAAFVEKGRPGRAEGAETLELSARVAQVLAAHPRLRVTAPLEEDQLKLGESGKDPFIAPADVQRLLVAAPGLVYSPPVRQWPAGMKWPQKWLRTDLPGLVPYVGAGGDERDVRLWAWLAFLQISPGADAIAHGADPKQPGLVLWDGALPHQTNPSQAADPNELVWFYPGSWFGIDEPVATVQLKWLRRAQQDYEYLWLAQQRGERLRARVMASLLTKPIQIQPTQEPDPTFALMGGTTDQQVWNDAMRLLSRVILSRPPGVAMNTDTQAALTVEAMQWAKPQERPVLMGRTAQWLWDPLQQVGPIGNWVVMRLGADVYNASDTQPAENKLYWTSVPAGSGWQVHPQPVAIPSLFMYRVERFPVEARFNLDALNNRSMSPQHPPLELTFEDGYSRQKTPLKVVLPVAACDRRQRGLDLNGSLEDWDAADLIQDGPMVRMFNRPAVQKQDLEYASTRSSVYTGWSEENLYLAFKLAGVPGAAVRPNFVDYQARRAWGEDLAEILIQPIYLEGNTAQGMGPILHVVCKPSGTAWVERKLDPKLNAIAWAQVEGANVRYVPTLDRDETWRGEITIPWQAIADKRGRPTLLRFNFVQHRHATGESASWAGPIDYGRDDSFMGLLYLREPVGTRAIVLPH